MWGLLKEMLSITRSLINWFYKRKKTLKDNLEASQKVTMLLDQLINDEGCDRSLVYQFHNGEYFYTGNSIDKMTCTHESVTKGTSREQVNSQAIFTSPYHSMMLDLLNNGIVFYEKVDKIKDYNTRMYFSNRGSTSVVMTLLRDGNSRPVGFVCLEYVKHGYDKVLIANKNKSGENGEPVEHSHIVQASKSIFDLLVYGRIKKK